MKIYVAGKWEDHEQCRSIMTELELAGHTITYDWTDHKFEDEGYPNHYCQNDIRGAKDCDCLFFNAFNERNYRGALVEMGIALGLDKYVFLLGHGIDSCIFIHSPLVRQFETVTDAINAINKVSLVEGNSDETS